MGGWCRRRSVGMNDGGMEMRVWCFSLWRRIRTDTGLRAEQLLVGPDIPTMIPRQEDGSWNQGKHGDVETHEQQPPKTRNSIKE